VKPSQSYYQAAGKSVSSHEENRKPGAGENTFDFKS
jgi:hypothetical protein